MGCLLIGLPGGLAERQQIFGPELRLFLFIGFLGGFTKFSTFGYEVLSFARENALAGATVIRGIEGFGASSRIHTSKILRLSEDLPVVIEIVDVLEKIEAFIPVIDRSIREGLAIVEKVEIRFYRSSKKK